jgi:hypothetical protein
MVRVEGDAIARQPGKSTALKRHIGCTATAVAAAATSSSSLSSQSSSSTAAAAPETTHVVHVFHPHI